MKTLFKNGITSVVERIKLLDTTSTTGAGKTALTFSSGGLIISTIADNEAAPTVYTSAGSTIETITTLGTFAAPTATKCRFKEVDATNHPGLYEIQIADARWAVSSARSIIITVQATGAAPQDAEVQLGSVDPYDSVRFGMTALPNANAEAAGGLYTRGSGAGQINQPANGMIDGNVVRWLGTAAATPNTAGVPLIDVGRWVGVVPNALTSGKVDAALVVRGGTAQAGAAGSITLDAGASATDNLYRGLKVLIASGTGAGQCKLITGYTGSTKVATVTPNWVTNPDATSVFVVGAWAGVDVEQWALSAPNALISGRVDANAGVVGDKTGYSLAQAFPTNFSSLVIDGSGRIDLSKWLGVAVNALNSGCVQADVERWINVVPNALVQGRVDAVEQIRTGTAQAGAAATITLDAGANATNDYYKDDHVVILAGTGIGQVREIASYVGATKVATITPNWITNPDNTSVFALLPMGMVDAAATVSGNVTVGGYAAGQDPATLVLVTPANKLATDASGRIDLGKWIGSAPDALSSGKIPADLKLWLAAAPASLTASGYVQSMLLRWLTDNAGGTPNALVSSRVDASAGAVADKTGYTVSTVQDKTGYTVSTVQDKTGYSLSAAGVQAIWDALTSALVTVNSIGSLLTTNINAAINSRMATFSLPTNFSSLAIDGNGRIDLGKWLGGVPAALSGVAGYVQTMLRRWLTDDASGTPLALSTNLVQSTGGGGGGGGTIYGSSGSIAYTYTVTKPGGSIPLAGATVWVSSDVAGVNRSQAQISDALGRVQFNLDPSTVYFWRRHSDWVFVDPDSQLIS